MANFRLDPYIWIHITGLVAAPVFLELVWLGLAIGESLSYLEFVLVALVGLVPIAWMQWKRPFNIYSLLFWFLRYDRLTNEQRQVLSLFKRPSQRIVTSLLTATMILVLWLIYKEAPLASGLAEQFFPPSKLLGLTLAALSFLLANLFVQVAFSTLLVMFTGKEIFSTTPPWEVEKVAQDFTAIGWAVKQIVPPLE